MSVGDPETFKRDAGPAFPQPIDQAADGKIVWADQYRVGGMSLRDYFAAKAMQAELTGYQHWDNVTSNAVNYQEVAARAYVVADAMLEARKAK